MTITKVQYAFSQHNWTNFSLQLFCLGAIYFVTPQVPNYFVRPQEQASKNTRIQSRYESMLEQDQEIDR